MFRGREDRSISFYLTLLCLNLLHLFFCVTARGGEHKLYPPGIIKKNYKRQLFSNVSFKGSDNGYMSNYELEQAVMEFGQRCSNISRIYSIGKSVNGIPLWVIEISDMPGKEEAEPSFKYIGNVHGDEPVGRELLIMLINWICDNYMKDSLARLIVENVHLHVLPSMNPDGFSLKRRGNTNNIDLNRDFPDQFSPLNDDIHGRQPETAAIINWSKGRQFTASASLHGGALVANYPWDGTKDKGKNYYACPDDNTFRFMASTYSHSHHNMSFSKEFPGGITNGASWYPIYGGMQDWNYIHAGCFELTLELSDNKWPNIEELSTLWEYNKLGLLNLIASVVKTGVHGRVFSSDTGRPLPASIMVKGINYTVKASRYFADYHRLLASRERYEVVATMPGYQTKVTAISLGETAMAVDFILDPISSAADNSPASVFCIHDCQNIANVFLYVAAPLALLLVICLVSKKRCQHLCSFSKRRQVPRKPLIHI